MKLNSLLLFFFLLAFVSIAAAQEKMLIKGLIFETASTKRIENVNISIKGTQLFTTSDEWGNFEIAVKLGDTLLFGKNNFEDQQRAITTKQNLIIYLKKAIALEEVVVKGQTKAAQQKEILDGYRSKGVFYNGNPPILMYVFSPLTALHELLGTDANNAKKFGSYIQRENAQSVVDRHFNKDVIHKAIEIPEKDLVEFMYLYRPKPKDVTYWNYYDDMNYVKKSYAKFLKHKEGTSNLVPLKP